MNSGWQKKVKEKLDGNGEIELIDPGEHHIESAVEYTEVDLLHVKSSNIVFAYMEISNPGGFAMAFELGFARALGKKVIFCEEPGFSNDQRTKYLELLRNAADRTCVSLESGIEILRGVINELVA